jgi:hypothetical protein
VLNSVFNQLGGWSVSWLRVSGAGYVCRMGPPDQIPPATTVLKRIQAAARANPLEKFALFPRIFPHASLFE